MNFFGYMITLKTLLNFQAFSSILKFSFCIIPIINHGVQNVYIFTIFKSTQSTFEKGVVIWLWIDLFLFFFFSSFCFIYFGSYVIEMTDLESPPEGLSSLSL